MRTRVPIVAVAGAPEAPEQNKRCVILAVSILPTREDLKSVGEPVRVVSALGTIALLVASFSVSSSADAMSPPATNTSSVLASTADHIAAADQHYEETAEKGKPMVRGEAITYGAAVKRIQEAKSVWSSSQTGAEAVCKQASGNGKTIGPEKDANGNYKVWHYHTSPRNGGHCFFGPY